MPLNATHLTDGQMFRVLLNLVAEHCSRIAAAPHWGLWNNFPQWIISQCDHTRAYLGALLWQQRVERKIWLSNRRVFLIRLLQRENEYFWKQWKQCKYDSIRWLMWTQFNWFSSFPKVINSLDRNGAEWVAANKCRWHIVEPTAFGIVD